ncbi:MAG: class I SAM-dependent methyltransferase [Phycisphaerae bacterium]
MTSGLYDALVERSWLVAHEEVDAAAPCPETLYKLIQPTQIDPISYPYEWCFSQLKDAALLTLDIQAQSMAHGMSLKDASAFNVQFTGGRPVLIDTLSFETYEAGRPWVAYRQFCRHFLAPLALMAYRDAGMNRLLRVHIDGLPLDLAAKLLPLRCRLRFGLFTHLYLHARSQRRYAGRAVSSSGRTVSEFGLRGLIDSLRSTVAGLRPPRSATEWGDYYDGTNYTEEALAHKSRIVEGFLDRAEPQTVWDLGANDGTFSRLAARRAACTVAFDADTAAVEKGYAVCRAERIANLLPLVMDLTNPSPSLGWATSERDSLLQRGPVDLVMALALIHHLAISNNVPLPHVAEFLSRLGRWAIVEFVPKSDSQVQRLLASREDIFPDYTRDGFERAFAARFTTEACEPITGSQRVVYLFRSHGHPA